MAFGLIGALLSVFLVQRFAPEASGSGIPHLEAVLHRLRTLDWRRILQVKFMAGTLAIGGGLALGREGPTVQMGGAIGAAVAEFLKDLPIYEALLERDLSRGGTQITLKEPMVIDLTVEQDAPFAGREVRMLGLPAGCVSSGREFVPTAYIRLEPHMTITGVIALEAAEGLAILRQGCKAGD